MDNNKKRGEESGYIWNMGPKADTQSAMDRQKIKSVGAGKVSNWNVTPKEYCSKVLWSLYEEGDWESPW